MASSTFSTSTSTNFDDRPAKLTHIGGTFILLLGALTAIGPFTIDMYLAAFPQITTDLGTRPAAVQLTITATLIGLALGQLLLGSVADAIGRRKPMLTGLGLYIIASVGIVFVTSVQLLTALRFLQGLGAAAGMVLSMAIVRDRFEGIQVGKAIARLMLVVGVSPCVAPLVGAQFLRLGSWRDMFIALAAVALALQLVAIFMLRESLPTHLRRSGGVVAAVRSYGALLRNPMFLGLALLSGFTMASLFTYVSSASFVFQEGFGLSATQFAIIFAAGGVTFTAGTQLNGLLLGRVAPEQILRGAVLGALVITATMVITSVIGLGVWPLILLLVGNMLAVGLLLPAISAVALDRNAHRAGSAAALIGATQFGIGAATAPLTGLFPEGSPTAMASVMLAATMVVVAIMFTIRPAMRRTTTRERSLARSKTL
ncbi:MFS transporter, DHA1 family, bicyclomycin/chloramphenicol resistance protein [Nakamurella panacisegetis]|uniref:MFS transporter, DHA1 family, bicyclomycin/chloramphenicol resistance protein n=1 Tax=Nakamurella panacisegetis TaxID=1090615 RepID=A0A1H0RCJ1_9ACTN|nr:multidrug effflux MFS transporter [Nakamurella panacisegetis]SDP26889.1 MFS transporter, DHA1 family, bicyclomycin/chloramphenicol resistance protein [Nakamurella panacisegetis]